MPESSADRADRCDLDDLAPDPRGLRGLSDLRDLRRVVAVAAGYARDHPEVAAVGGWWEPEPLRQLPARPAMRPGEGREAAVLMLFCLPDDGGPGAPGDAAGGGSGEGVVREPDHPEPDRPEPDRPEPYLVVTQRAAGLSAHPGQVAFPGGGLEEHDAGPVAAALREAGEEIGLDPSGVEVLGLLPPAPVPVSGFMVSPVLAVSADPGTLTPEAGEVDRVIRVPVSALVDPENRRTSELRRRGRVLRAPAFVVDGTLIWGFTAILIDRLITRLGWERPWDAARTVDPRDYRQLIR